MTQYTRPSGDVSIGSWVDSDDAYTDLFAYINSPTLNLDTDATYIYLDQSMMDDTPAIFYCSGSPDHTITDPESSADHNVVYRGWAEEGSPGMGYGTMVAKLYEGATLRGTDPTVRDLSATKTTFTWPLSTAQANSITDYNILRLEIYAQDPSMVGPIQYCSWAYFSCPDAPSPPPAATQNGSAFMLFLDT